LEPFGNIVIFHRPSPNRGIFHKSKKNFVLLYQ
jgi:hypothetical protein